MTPKVLLIGVLAVLNKEPRHTTDRHEPANERGARFMELSEAIGTFAKTPEEAALMATVVIHESTLARYIAEGRCKDGPKGQRCDGLRSRGYFQNRQISCPKGWAQKPGSREELFEMAKCSRRDLARGWYKCGTAEGAFAAFNGSHSCKAPWAKSRVRTFTRVLGQLRGEAAS
jgi:hypothetical protein